MPRLFKEKRGQAIGMLAAGGSKKEVSRPRSSRLSVTTARQYRRLLLQRFREQFRAATVTVIEIPGTHNPYFSVK